MFSNKEECLIYIQDRPFSDRGEYEKWLNSVNKKYENFDLAIEISGDDIDSDFKVELYDYCKELAQKEGSKKIIIHEQITGVGGFGDGIQPLFTPLHVSWMLWPVVILLGKGFIQGVGREIGGKIFKKLVKRKKDTVNKEIGSEMVSLPLDEKTFNYVFLKHHSEEEKQEAFENIIKHVTGFDKNQISQSVLMFVWDRKNKSWEIL